MSQKAPATETAYSPISPQRELPTSPTPSKGVTSYKAGIAWSWFVVTVPIAALTIALLVMVFRYRVKPNDVPFENLRVSPIDDEGNAVYVGLNSSFILFVTSLAGSLTPMLSGLVLFLASFPMARQLSDSIQKGSVDRLPTPYQLALTLKFLGGGVLGAVWSWILYLCTWRTARQPQTPPLIAASSVAIMTIIMGILVSAADLWLHLTTRTVPFTHVSAISDPGLYSFGLGPECLINNNSIAAQEYANMKLDDPICSIEIGGVSAALRNLTMSVQVLDNSSADATVYTHTAADGTPYTYLGVPPDDSLTEQDFTARTYGAQASCSMISQRCGLVGDFYSIDYNCSGTNGTLRDSTLTAKFFANSSMYDVGNPYYVALSSLQYMYKEEAPGGLSNPDFVSIRHSNGVGFMLGCNMTIYDVEYDHVNGQISRFDTQISNTSVSNIWYTSTDYLQNTGDWKVSVQQAITTAIRSSANSREFADKVALVFSKATLAMGAQSVQPRPALVEQARRTTLVARIPTAALVTTVVFCSLYIIAGIVLTSMAIWASQFRNVPDIQARLGITGLVADRFEEQKMHRRIEDSDGLFQEYYGEKPKRVAIEADNETGWFGYSLWGETGPQRDNTLVSQIRH